MKNYLKYIGIVLFTIFSFYYTDKVLELSEYNNTILVSIDDYALLNDKKCREGSINEEGIILGMSGISVDKNKSYSNMKGIGFREDLIEYKSDKCILNKDDNKDKYIISSNKYNNNISLVIDTVNLEYYEDMVSIAENENVHLNILVSNNNYDNLLYKENILLKTNSDIIKEFKKKCPNFYCVNYNSFDVIDYCAKEGINSIKITNYIDSNLLLYMKKNLDKGKIYFIKENIYNLNELLSTIKYIKSRGYNIVSINELF